MIQNREQHNSSIYRHAMLLAQKAGLEGNILLEPMDSGGNNRVFSLTVGNELFLLKSYFHNSKDFRDRLGHEFAFTSFAWKYGVKAVSRPIACDHAHFLGLYGFIDGKKIRSGEVTWEHIGQALDFFVELNRHKDEPNASALPVASEACFSVTEHLSCVDRRLKKLQQVNPCNATDTEALDFIHGELSPKWETARKDIVSFAKDLKIEIDEYLPEKERFLSPSDFGFHNAILEKNGKLRFIDFEYAGWDDPAKMICDFFCQPEVPVPLKYFSRFLREINVALDDPKYFRNRVNLLFSVHQIKWCCIMLNDFLPVDSERRKYASDNEDRRNLQLTKARRYFNKLILATDTHGQTQK